MKLKFGLLDFGYRMDTDGSTETLFDILDYAKLADRIGYHSIWYGEHYNSGKAYYNPEILLPIIAGVTNKINVGSGGVLIAAHSPYRISLNYKLLSTLFPTRIDLGIACAVYKDKFTSLLLDEKDIENLPFDIADRKSKALIDLIFNEEKYRKDGTFIPPFNKLKPNVWKLKTSFEKIGECIEDQTNYCCSLFHNTSANKEIDKVDLRKFKNSFFKKFNRFPEVAIAFAGICDVNIDNANNTFNHLKQFIMPDNNYLENCIIGTPKVFYEKIIQLSRKSGVDYFIFHDLNPNIVSRQKSLRLLSKQFKL